VFFVVPALADTAGPVINHDKASIVESEPLIISAEIVDEDGVFDPTVLWRVPPETKFKRAPMSESIDGFEVEIDLPEGTSEVEYFIEAYDNDGNGPGLAGSAEDPLLAKTRRAIAVIGGGEEIESLEEEENDEIFAAQDPNEVRKKRFEEIDDEGGSGLWIGVSVGVVVIASAAVGGFFAYRYFTREDVPSFVEVPISGPSPVRGTP